MEQQGKWIWLDRERHPLEQDCPVSIANPARPGNYCMAEFRRTYDFRWEAVSAKIRVSGDTVFRLLCNNRFVGVGPAAAGGDFGANLPMPRHFINEYEIDLSGVRVEFLAQVQIPGSALCDWSQGRGGFFLEAEILLEDGSRRKIGTGADWEARRNGRYPAPDVYDQRLDGGPWEPAWEIDEPVWNLTPAPIPMLDFQTVQPLGAREFVVGAGEERVISVEFDRIYSACLRLYAEVTGPCEITASFRELDRADDFPEEIVFNHDSHYLGMRMHSVGTVDLHVRNRASLPALICPSLSFCSYPVRQEGRFRCAEPDFDRTYDLCKWALRICRQTLHLDSPRHQEPLACTGDYYIESLMTAAVFGDMRLARLDLLRTADRLRQTVGWMFHTSYSLIWVLMLEDVYRFAGDKELVRECLPALRTLLKRFHSYTDGNGVVTTPPNYMFLDWIVVDGYSLHHPPKALGQTALNAFYYGALRAAVRLLLAADDPEYRQFAPIWRERADRLRVSFADYFYDEEKKLFFDGQDTPEPALRWRPANPSRRYFSKHGNILAVLFGLCEPAEGRRILETVLDDPALPDMQPYFTHFALEAVWKAGLFSKYGLKLLRRWDEMTAATGKGLQEGWVKPEEGYAFDYSHAWGGTPAYQLPMRLLGLEMLEPGYRRIRLVPRLYGLKWAEIELPTPYGPLYCRMEDGRDPVLRIPEEITAEIC